MNLRHFAVAALIAIALSGCSGEDKALAVAPVAQEVTFDAVGHYCGMNLVEHAGPKGQIFVNGRDKPVWFTTIKQVFAYTILPDEPKGIAAIYVHDMGRATNWDQPEDGSWIDARKAFYVIESQFIGGMGAEDALPFGEEAKAQEFAKKHGGRVAVFADIPENYVLNHEDAAQGIAAGQPPAGAH
ncbi:nitrous oxide reductase accessory protein NosL [Alcaligenaceae bacterium]|nr:nitrous oxide reductase accessory protein NosL [Alcaligenaceae bacterium]